MTHIYLHVYIMYVCFSKILVIENSKLAGSECRSIVFLMHFVNPYLLC